MVINVTQNNEKAIMKIEGRLDTTTAPQLEKELNSLPADTTDLVLDMEKLDYISSAGLRIILSAQKKMSLVGTLKLVSVNETVMEVFEITGFSDILTIE